jgi:hypothetical protein
MSDTRSRRLPVEIQTPPPGAIRLIDTNRVLQKIFQQLSTEVRGRFILRCDELPLLQADEADLETIFSSLLKLLLEQKTAGTSKPFLHIQCRLEEESLKVNGGINQYNIQFTTTLKTNTDWLATQQVQLNDISTRLQRNRGRLTVSGLTNNCCVFSFSLPGKTL